MSFPISAPPLEPQIRGHFYWALKGTLSLGYNTVFALLARSVLLSLPLRPSNLPDRAVPATTEGFLATPLPRRPSATRVRWLVGAVGASLPAQVAPQAAPASGRKACGSDVPRPAATSSSGHDSPAARPVFISRCCGLLSDQLLVLCGSPGRSQGLPRGSPGLPLPEWPAS